MKKLNNEQKYNNYKKIVILKITIILLLICTVVLSILSLTIKLSIIYPLITFVTANVLKKYRSKLSFRD